MKRILIGVAFALTAFVVASAVGVYFYKHVPAWYAPNRMTDAQRTAMAQKAEAKVIQTYNWASENQAHESAKARGVKLTTSAPAKESVVSFTADELNALFDKWSLAGNLDAQYGRYMTDPAVGIEDGRLILGATINRLGTVVSLHFAPSIDADGKIHLDLKRVLGGSLPLPKTMWTTQKQMMLVGMRPQLATWQRQARMDASGATNTAGMAASITKLLLTALLEKSADAVIFIPLDGHRGVPVRITAVDLKDQTLTLHVQQMQAGDRKAFFARLKEPVALGGE